MFIFGCLRILLSGKDRKLPPKCLHEMRIKDMEEHHPTIEFEREEFSSVEIIFNIIIFNICVHVWITRAMMIKHGEKEVEDDNDKRCKV